VEENSFYGVIPASRDVVAAASAESAWRRLWQQHVSQWRQQHVALKNIYGVALA